VGADATNATEQLYSLVGDDQLFDQLQDLAAQDAAADCRSVVLARIKELSDNGIEGFDTVLAALKAGQIAATAPVAPAAPVAESDGSCNYTAEGEHCPEHGLMECGSGMYEGEEDTISRLRELSGMGEGYYDLNDEGMQPIDLSANPSFKDIVNRYSQLYYQGHEGTYDEEESAESDAIEQYVAQRFGQKGSDHLTQAAQTSYFGRDDGRGRGGSRSSNLGQPSQPGGNFRTTKAGVMNKQDAKTMKNRVADRLGSHPAPNLPESVEDSPVASAITRRILLQRSDLLSKYGPEKVMAAIDDVADFVGDVDEIGSSDVSGWIKQVEQSLAGMAEEVAVTTGNPPLEETTALQGQYGHSGKLQKFDEVEQDIVARLRELSGLIRPA